VEILSTGGTADLLRRAEVPVKEVSEATGFPEMLDGRVKTLHPAVHGGLLARRDKPDHLAALAKHGIGLIDLVVVNLYPFEATVAKEGATPEEIIEQIDIGGPSMIRSAAKNHASVGVVCNPDRYGEVLDALKAHEGALPAALLKDLAREAFRTTARYDAAIGSWLAGQTEGKFPGFFYPLFEKVADLRYGENPHQKAALYRESGATGPSLATGEVLWGKELSFNNLLDLDSGLALAREFAGPACVIIKHNNPCGCSEGDSLVEAYRRAQAGDPVSAFGCVMALNRVVDAETAAAIASPDTFVEAIVAPGFAAGALDTLTRKQAWGKNVRIVKVGDLASSGGDRGLRNYQRIAGGLLLQDYDRMTMPTGPGPKCVTKRHPSEEETRDLMFAWTVCKHVMSNAIVFAKDRAVVGVGAGQMSRVDSSEIAVRKAGDRAKGAVLASDAFFPFPDGLEVAARAGVTAAIQPGGSRNDTAVIEAANAAGVAMLFTGMRHFRH
ncbi:MAG: bifunctional phosphoribosylaminoimidazolecarboxamide formyltransferase/IMP cyclohydrolase, partial [Planctomycetaceae bacterium]|nr:bifunctional phosphoribosylaminoimidazolecarboxamide formyltransferase/IMP cyclohydrolase [Planctomycetaceae bacterium]